MVQREIAATSVSYTTSVGTAIAGLAFNEWLMLGGMILTAGTFIVNWRYKHLHYKLQRENTQTIHD